MEKLLSCGKIVNTHGLGGCVKMELWCDGPEFIKRLKSLYIGREKLYEIEYCVENKANFIFIKFKGIDNMDDALSIKGKIAYIDRDWVKLPEGVYFFVDLIGLAVVDADTNKEYGKITDVFRSAANDVYQVKSASGKEYLMPAVKEFIAKTDIEGGKLYVRPIKGMFDDED